MGYSTGFDTIDAIDEAARDPSRWGEAVQLLSERFSGVAAGITTREIPAGGVQQTWTGLPASFEAAYVRDYHPSDPWVAASRNQGTGLALTTDELIPREKQRQNAFLQELWRDAALGDLMAVKLLESPSSLTTVGLVRGARQRAFSVADRRRLQALVPRLTHAVRSNAALGQLEQTRAALLAGIEHLGVALLLLDRRGRVLFATRQALEQQGRGLTVTKDRLHLSPASTQHALQAALHRLERGGLPPASALISEGPSGTLELSVLSGVVPGAAAVLVIKPIPARSSLAESFGLTSAEERLCLALKEGSTLREAAERFEVSIHTVRSQLQAVFHKTGTHRQTQLLRLLSGG